MGRRGPGRLDGDDGGRDVGCRDCLLALVDHADSQCSSDDDCAKFGQTVCVNGGCVPGVPPPEAGLLDLEFPPLSLDTCTTTQDCLAEHGVGYICRHDGTCQALLTNDCPLVVGSYASDDTVLMGAIIPLAGPHASTGAALKDAITLGVERFQRRAATNHRRRAPAAGRRRLLR